MYEKLKALSAENVLPMHMPGHKRNLREFPWLGETCGAFDATETEGLDDLHAPAGVIARILRRAEKLWGSRRTFLSVNGSTGGIFAVLAACGNGGVLAARNCHRSVFNAASYLGLHTEYVIPPTVGEYGFFGSVDAAEVGKRLDETGCKAVVVTSPTYEGVLSDTEAIAEQAHARGAVLILDAAHGAHFGLSDAFSGNSGADVVVTSLHKTLPSLTQTALVHVMSDRVDVAAVSAAMSAFVTSSPSYILMAGVEKMLDYLEQKGAERLDMLARELAFFRERTRAFGRLRVFDGEREKFAEVFKTDTSKVYIDCKNCSFGGFELKRRLRAEFGTELESAAPYGALAYVTAGDDADSLARLFSALAALDDEEVARAEGRGKNGVGRDLSVGAKGCGTWTPGAKAAEMREALRSPSEIVSLRGAVGRVSADSLWAYPPGVPVILPGERIEENCVRYAESVRLAGGETVAAYGGREGYIRVALSADAPFS